MTSSTKGYEDCDKPVFRMEISVPPLKRKIFAFTEDYFEKKAASSPNKCAICACGTCDCQYPPVDDLIVACPAIDDLDDLAAGCSSKPTHKSLKELYMALIGDQKEWDKYSSTMKLVESKNKTEMNVFANVLVGVADDVENIHRFTDFERYVLVGVLNELIDKLVILGANKPKVQPRLNFRPPKIRFLGKIKRMMFDTETNLLISEGDGVREVYRFQKLRTVLEHVMKITRDEISERSTCEGHRGFISLEEKKAAEDDAINSHFTDSKSLIEDLNSIKTKNDKDTEVIIKKLEKIRKNLQGEIEQEMFRYGEYSEYFKDWADAQLESEKRDIDAKYFIWMENELKNSERECNTENRVHRDIVMFLKLSSKKLAKDYDSWSKKYDEDIEQMEMETSKVRQLRKENHKTVADMIRTFGERHEEIQSYLKVRAERLRNLAHEMAVKQAVVRIQAWWRGTMVRWELGEYDSNRQKKKKSKSSKRK